jgi:hypothetical protein
MHALMFSLSETKIESTADGQNLKCLVFQKGKTSTCKFELELSLPNPKPNQPFSFGKALIRRVEGSESGELLSALAAAHKRHLLKLNSVNQNTMEVPIAVLGTKLSRGQGTDVLAGEFTSNPPGTWIATKLSLADGEAEVYLNINPTDAVAEFSPKDDEYGDRVVQELSKVL